MAFQFELSQQVLALQSEIQQNNILYEGRKSIIANMDSFYEGLELDTDEKKLARWKRCNFYIYYPKIVSSFGSSIYKKPPHYELPENDNNLTNVDLLKNSLNEYVSQIPLEVLKQGFCATIVDYSDSQSRPYLIFVKPENFVMFNTSNEKGYPEISKFIYSETEEVEDPDNEFKLKTKKVHYVWDLFDGQARVRKYERMQAESDKTNYEKGRDKSGNEDILVDTNLLVMNGKPLNELPIVIHGKETNNYTIDKSVLQDISDLNIGIFNRVVDQIEVLHMTALPTPYITGADSDDPNLPTTLGSNKIWFIDDSDSSVGLLEFSGKSYEAHEAYINELKETMAIMGAQILKQGGLSRETATSVLIRTGQETAIITNIVQNISSQVVEVLKYYFKWLGKNTDTIIYKLNSDFANVDMEPNAQIALVRSWIDGAISHKTLFAKMKEGEIIPANKTFEDELADIQNNPPSFPAKEKDAEIAEEAAKKSSEYTIKEAKASGNSDREKLQGSNLETGNSVKNTEIKN